MSEPQPTDQELAARLASAFSDIREQLGQVVVGQEEVVEQVLIAIFCGGHALLVGVPGLAKTLLVSTLADVLDLGSKRVQFTPDLMPGDITGTEVLEEDPETGRRRFRFVHGPVFTNLLLADEVNRTPPKTQAALLEAMQEHRVTSGETTHALPEPFFVLATQNPIEQEGTFPLPEAQLDRFLLQIEVGYPDHGQEMEIIRRVTGEAPPVVKAVLTGAEVLSLQGLVRRVPAAEPVIQYAADLVRATRPDDSSAPAFVKSEVAWGAGPRAGISLVMAAKARAVLHGRTHATTADVRAVVPPVLRHRVLPTFGAEAAGVSAGALIGRLLETVQPPAGAEL